MSLVRHRVKTTDILFFNLLVCFHKVFKFCERQFTVIVLVGCIPSILNVLVVCLSVGSIVMKEVHVYSTSDSLFWRVDFFPKGVSFASGGLDLRVKSFDFRVE